MDQKAVAQYQQSIAESTVTREANERALFDQAMSRQEKGVITRQANEAAGLMGGDNVVEPRTSREICCAHHGARTLDAIATAHATLGDAEDALIILGETWHDQAGELEAAQAILSLIVDEIRATVPAELICQRHG